jgi:hypothetical protein
MTVLDWLLIVETCADYQIVVTDYLRASVLLLNLNGVISVDIYQLSLQEVKLALKTLSKFAVRLKDVILPSRINAALEVSWNELEILVLIYGCDMEIIPQLLKQGQTSKGEAHNHNVLFELS